MLVSFQHICMSFSNIALKISYNVVAQPFIHKIVDLCHRLVLKHEAVSCSGKSFSFHDFVDYSSMACCSEVDNSRSTKTSN